MRSLGILAFGLLLAGCVPLDPYGQGLYSGGLGHRSGGYGSSSYSSYQSDPPLRIVDARYGIAGKTCDATRSVRRECEGESICTFKAGNELCGDPAPRQVKTLEVTYRCRGRAQSVTRTEGKHLSLSC
jgi:hypothetical protein